MENSVQPFQQFGLGFEDNITKYTDFVDDLSKWLIYDCSKFKSNRGVDTEGIQIAQFALLVEKLRNKNFNNSDSLLVVINGDESLAKRVQMGLTAFDKPEPSVTYSTKLHKYSPPAHAARLAARILANQIAQPPDVNQSLESQHGSKWGSIMTAQRKYKEREPCDVPRSLANTKKELLYCWYTGQLGHPEASPPRDTNIGEIYSWANSEGYKTLAAYTRSFLTLPDK
jgi:hypothetical protein